MEKITSQNLKVKVFQILHHEVDAVEIPKNTDIPAIIGTMSIHEIRTDRPGRIQYRKLSCHCWITGTMCNCYPYESALLVKDKSVASKINLAPEMRALFERRLEEGYDVRHTDLTKLSEEDKRTYLLWVSFKGASAIPLVSGDASDSNGSRDPDEDSGPLTFNEPDNEHGSDVDPDAFRYFTVYFTKRGGIKGMFYIGQMVTEFGDQITLKFLQRVGNRTKFYYDWPKRDDTDSVTREFVLTELSFDGPPPFLLDNK